MTTVSSLDVLIGANVSGLQRGLNQASGDVESWSANLGQKLAGLGGQMTMLTAPLVAFGVQGVSVAANFESSMAEISARTGMVGADLDIIREKALEMGAKTAFSAQDASDAFLQLLTSGQSAQEALTSLPAILDAAAASGENLGTAADGITDIMAAFGIEVETFEDGSTTVEGVVDSLARAAGASSASMGDLFQGFANVGGIAKSFGLNVNETAAILGIFAENGVAAAESGTLLKSMLLNMSADTAKAKGAWAELGTSLYDAQGNVRPLETVIGELDTALDALPLEEQNRLMKALGGSYGILGLTALRNSISISEMEERMWGSADAATVARARMETFKGKVDGLRGSIETLQIRAFTPLIQNGLTPLIERLTSAINVFADWIVVNPVAADVLMDVAMAAAIAGPVIAALGLAIMAGPALAAVVAVGAVAGLISAFDNLIGFDTRTEEITENMLAVSTPLERLGAALASIQIGETTVGEIAGKIQQAVKDALTSVTILPGDVSGIPQKIVDAIGGAFGGTSVDLAGITTFSEQNFNAILDTVISIAGIIFGGPIGMAIGAASLISKAIESDFLGIGTFLQESGIATSVETAFNDIKSLIDGIIQSVFGGGGEQVVMSPAAFDMTGMMPSDDMESAKTAVLAVIAKDITMAIDAIKTAASGITTDISKGLSDLGDGIKDFIEGISGAETEGLYEVVRAVAGAIGGLVTLAAQIVGVGASAILSGFGAALGPFGESVGSFITAVSRLGEGDIGGAVVKFGESLLQFAGSIVALPIGVLDSLIEKFNSLTNLNLPTVSEALDGIGKAASALIEGALTWLRDRLKELETTISNLVNNGIKLFTDTVTGLQGLLSGPLEALKSLFNNTFGWIKTNVIDPFLTTLGTVLGEITKILQGLGLIQEGSSGSWEGSGDGWSGGGSGAGGGSGGGGSGGDQPSGSWTGGNPTPPGSLPGSPTKPGPGGSGNNPTSVGPRSRNNSGGDGGTAGQTVNNFYISNWGESWQDIIARIKRELAQDAIS